MSFQLSLEGWQRLSGHNVVGREFQFSEAATGKARLPTVVDGILLDIQSGSEKNCTKFSAYRILQPFALTIMQFSLECSEINC